MPKGMKRGAKVQWMEFNRAAEYFLFPRAGETAAVSWQRSLETLKALIKEGKVRFRKPDSRCENGTVSREDVLRESGALAWHDKEKVPDSSKKGYGKRLRDWLKVAPKPWS